MVTVTDKAKEGLKSILETRSLAPGKLLRLAMPPVWKGEGDFGIVIDDQGENDYVVSFQGMDLLLVDCQSVGQAGRGRAGLQGVAQRHGVYPGRVLILRAVPTNR